MERSLYIEHSEDLASVFEYGSLKERHNILRKITSNSRLCETVIISLRALTLFNEDKNVMKAKNKLTDEQLAAMIENGLGFETIQFEDLSTFEVVSVAEKSMELIEEDAFQQVDFSFDTSCFRDRFEPLAMCGFLGEDEDDEMPPTEDENIDTQEEEEE